MNSGGNQKNMKEEVLSAIHEGRLKMRPRWQFVLGGVLFGVGVMLVCLILVYLISLSLFAMQQGGSWFVPEFGLRGVWAFLRTLPFILILLTILFIVILEVMVRKYSFAYRKPLLYSALAIILVVLIGGALAAPLHRELFRSARDDNSPVLGNIYRGLGPQHLSDIRRGEVVASTTDGFLMEDVFRGTSTVVITSQTRLPLGADFAPGDTVVVFGDMNPSGTIKAYGIREVGDTDFDSGLHHQGPTAHSSSSTPNVSKQPSSNLK